MIQGRKPSFPGLKNPRIGFGGRKSNLEPELIRHQPF
jgi:hypothetical protein